MRCRVPLALLGLPLVVSSSLARTWHILPDGTGDAPTIQAGVDSSSAGDVVLLASGVYTGPGNRDVVFHGQAVTVRSESSDPTTCTLDCEGLGRGFYLANADAGVVLDGMTVTNGTGHYGGGIFTLAMCVVRQCIVSSCVGVDGGGAYLGWNATMEECSFIDNVAFSGGGVHVANPGGNFAVLTGCMITGNHAYDYGGGVTINGANAQLEDCVVADNTAHDGGGLAAFFFCLADVVGCTFTGNAATRGAQGAAGLYIDFDENAVTLVNSIISFSVQGRAVINESSNKSGAFCTDIYGNADGDWTPDFGSPGMGGNFSADPLYCDAAGGDYTLRSDSPCAPPGVTGCGLVGALPVGCGPVSVTALSWGKMKWAYR